MTIALVYDPAMAGYRFPPPHPMLPERFVLAIDLMRIWGLLAEGADASEPRAGRAVVVRPEPSAETDIARVHSAEYIAAVKRASDEMAAARYGLGPGDTPVFANMHGVSARIAGGTVRAVDGVLDGSFVRAFAPAGGLHHAHYDRAAGFCVYNDCAIAIARATTFYDGIRVAYVDIDAHHGDGVQEAFYERPDVLTLSVHESGRYLYPGTGAARDTGQGAGAGYAINIPMPPFSGPQHYERAFDRAVGPALRSFGPDLIVAQLGADCLCGDPLTHLGQTVSGHAWMVKRLVEAADRLCEGRFAATGGGGYDAFSATPRAWACAMAVMLGVEPPVDLPPEWIASAMTAACNAGVAPPHARSTFAEEASSLSALSSAEIDIMLDRALDEVEKASPLLG